MRTPLDHVRLRDSHESRRRLRPSPAVRLLLVSCWLVALASGSAALLVWAWPAGLHP